MFVMGVKGGLIVAASAKGCQSGAGGSNFKVRIFPLDHTSSVPSVIDSLAHWLAQRALIEVIVKKQQ